MATTQKHRQGRRFLLILPVLTLPLLTIIFWSLGGGQSSAIQATDDPYSGLLGLPDADFSDQAPLSKLDYYNQARRDSLTLDELVKNDPAYDDIFDFEDAGEAYNDRNSSSLGSFPTALHPSLPDHEQQVFNKLAHLERTLNTSLPSTSTNSPSIPSAPPAQQVIPSTEIDRLEQLMAGISDTPAQDQELQQLTDVLERILDIQHPERIKQQQQSQVSSDSTWITLEKSDSDFTVSRLGDIQQSISNSSVGFYGLNRSSIPQIRSNIIRAVIHEDQTVVDGSVVKLRFLDDVKLAGMIVPKNTFVFGLARLSGERLHVDISEVRWQDALLPLKIALYDLDGMKGIYVPGSITRESGIQSADRSIQTLSPSIMDPSWSGQAAGAGIETVKSLLSRKTKLIKLHLKAGHQVLLRDDQNHQFTSN